MIERDGVRVGYEVFEPLDGGPGCPTLVLLTSWAIVHMRQWKPQVPVARPAVPGGHRRGPGQRAADRPGTRPPTPTASSSRTPSPCMDAVGVGPGGARRAVDGRAARAAARGVVPGPRRPASVAVGAAPRRGRSRRGFDEVPEHRTRAGRRRTGTTGSPTTAAGSSSSVRRCFTEPHSTKQWEDGVGWGLETDARDPAAHRRRDRRRRPTPTRRTVCRAVRCPVLVVHGDATTIVPLRRSAPGWRSGPAASSSPCRAAGTPAACVTRCGSTLLVREFVEPLGGPAARPPQLDARPQPRVAGRCSSPRRSGSGTPCATSPSPTSCARCTRTWRSTGSPSIP